MNKEEYLQQIAKAIVDTTTEFHRKGANVIVELHNSLLRVTSLIGEEMERLKHLNKKEKKDATKNQAKQGAEGVPRATS